ncbi:MULTISPECIES: DUF3817 domain-containing protein [Mammaliicoccus]|uniref:DUF3817 domain-containing protein n=1 Tax=Mammaliicoccus vitulinus TaxID=71237 RepID=A0A2T4PVS9_9STAP|nr:DUF3817 domain-containing protein [Mammaliicoccus vitulinus]MBM6630132.1 DUF3817 domain-containing protein [Mammaliicoccus vitulinus]MBO3076300.1 DUF3817 domain-containing protein [Mammaliicoccus vitulinus]MEB7657528.1 DUF3817 domain-containing protein [Mammaliicoccus vitulinus]PNZ39892.1 DUF3817 domain-containing protein [Mammaliicoccus vitulinus]PTI30595.1 DUF3817 domain-containing protein [Mammaliicoccus vitulinus]
MSKTTLTSLFRFTGYLEGGSLLLLVFIAMPIKYILSNPNVVAVLGMVHGGLFTIYLIMILVMAIIVRTHIKWSVIAFVSAFIPFGTFIFDRFFINSKSYQNITQ